MSNVGQIRNMSYQNIFSSIHNSRLLYRSLIYRGLKDWYLVSTISLTIPNHQKRTLKILKAHSLVMMEVIWRIMGNRNVTVEHVWRESEKHVWSEGNKIAYYLANLALEQGDIMAVSRSWKYRGGSWLTVTSWMSPT